MSFIVGHEAGYDKGYEAGRQAMLAEVVAEVESQMDLAGVKALQAHGTHAEDYWLGRTAALDDLLSVLRPSEGSGE